MIFETEHVTRYLRECCNCGGPIKPGQKYVRVRITPQHDDFDNTGWLHYSSHLPLACSWYGARAGGKA